MTKKIAILLILVFLGCNVLWADDFYGFGSKGMSITMDIMFIVVGGGLATVPLFAPFETEEYNYILYGTGGGLALIGIIGLIYDLAQGNSSYAPDPVREENPIHKHLSFAIGQNRVYVGLRFKF